ncbi:MAG: SDR family NAD(P)-dependent oxidoreductase [Actinobacteria bacterium]|nr:SDR family NAD(P)-dependent oxidoreductase [Actinomycetota bacterium]
MNGERPSTPSLRVDGAVALVTGAGRGIGEAAAVALAEAGADLVLMSRTADDLARVGAAVRELGRGAEEIVCDVTDTDRLMSTIAGLHRIDVLVTSAGTNTPQPFLDVDEALDRLLALNVKSVFKTAQAVARKMVQQGTGGSIIHISSQLGHVGSGLNRSVYCTTKHAVEGLVRATVVELASQGIRVNSVAPTFLETPMTAPYFADPAFRTTVESRIPLGRVGAVEDIMGAIVCEGG